VIEQRVVTLWLGVIEPPVSHSAEAMLAEAQSIFGRYGVRIDVRGRRNVALPHLADLHVGDCGDRITEDQTELFADRGQALDSEIYLYFVRSTVDAFNGCAGHPDGRPGAVVISHATIWTLAHELGHVLSLEHNSDDRYLMTVNGTASIVGSEPLLSRSDLAAISRSPYASAV